MKTLTLSLKKQWFDKIKSGEKKEEYRERKDYWFNRFFHSMNPDGTSCKYDRLVFTLGYPKATDTERRLVFRNPKIRVGEGKPEWGAEPGKKYFVITWDNKRNTNDND